MFKQALLLTALFGFGVSNVQAGGCCSSKGSCSSTKAAGCSTKSCDTKAPTKAVKSEVKK